jgi:hypothetical protein
MMVHNVIQHYNMQPIAETYNIISTVFCLAPADAAASLGLDRDHLQNVMAKPTPAGGRFRRLVTLSSSASSFRIWANPKPFQRDLTE